MAKPIQKAPRGDEELRARVARTALGLRFDCVHRRDNPWVWGQDLPSGSPTFEGSGTTRAVGSGHCYEPADASLLETGVSIAVGDVLPCPIGQVRCWLEGGRALAAWFAPGVSFPSSMVLRSRVTSVAPGQALDVGSFTWFSDAADVLTPFGDYPPQVGVITLWQLLDLGFPGGCQCERGGNRGCRPWKPAAT